MTELARLREAPCPRDAKLCKLVARRLSPAWGFVAYGVLYAFLLPVWAFVVGLMGSMFGLASVLGKPLPSWAVTVCTVVAIVGFSLAWWPFVAWVKRRRSAGYRLGEHGVFMEGTVAKVLRGHVRGSPFTRATLQVEHLGKKCSVVTSVGGHPAELEEGRSVPVLLMPGSKYAGAFVLGERMTGAKVG